MNTIVQSSNCQIVKSICYFTISRFHHFTISLFKASPRGGVVGVSSRGRVGERLPFPPPSRGRSGGDCPIVQLFNCPIVKSIHIAKILQRAQKKRLRDSYA